MPSTSGNFLVLENLVTECHRIAKNNGWWEKPREVPEMLMLCVTELSEAMEEYRNPDGFNTFLFTEELADTIIRIFDMAGGLELDLPELILAKMEKNKTRPYRHGGKRA